MSWFKRRPRVKESNKHKPETTSPMAEQLLKEAKLKVIATDRLPKKK